MIRRTWVALCACVILLLASGCATQRAMPFKEPTEKLEDKAAVYLLMVTLENKYKPSFQPRLISFFIDRKDGDKWEKQSHSADVGGTVVVPGAPVNSYAARLELPPGEYRVRALFANAAGFLINGMFELPLYAPLQVREPRGVFYLGNLRGTVREAKEGDIKAGPPIPLIDQAVVGASGGTFDAVISDAWKTDEATFRNQFPALAKVPVRKAVLPPYDRARVKREADQ